MGEAVDVRLMQNQGELLIMAETRKAVKDLLAQMESETSRLEAEGLLEVKPRTNPSCSEEYLSAKVINSSHTWLTEPRH